MNTLQYMKSQQFIQSMDILLASDQPRVALLCGLSGLELLSELYFAIQANTKKNPEFTTKDFPYSKEKVNRLIAKIKDIIKKVEKLEAISNEQTETINKVIEEVSLFSEKTNYLKQKIENKLLIQKLKKTWKIIVIWSKNKAIRIIAGTIFTIVFGWWLTINTYDFIAFRPTGTYYPAHRGWDTFNSGWIIYWKPDNARWNNGARSTISVDIPKSAENLAINLFLKDVLVSPSVAEAKEQRILAYIGNKPLGSIAVSTKQVASFVIPKELISSKNTIIEFVFPDAKTPKSLGMWYETQKRAIYLSGFSIDLPDSAPYYRLGKKIFVANKANNKYLIKGWHIPWYDHRWLIDGDSELLLKAPAKAKDLEMIIDIKYVLYKKAVLENQRVSIFVNNQFITKTTLSKDDKLLKVKIPKEAYAGSKKILIKFICPDATSPTSLGLHKDDKRLSFAPKSITLKYLKN